MIRKSSRTGFKVASIAAIALAAAVTGAVAHGKSHGKGHGHGHGHGKSHGHGKGHSSKPALELETQGFFWAGGEVVTRTQNANKIRRNQAYVEYFIPKKRAKNAAPIVLTHTAMPGVVWRTTPDGREGWAEYFVRQGYPVFVIDPPGVGRAGFDIDAINAAATGRADPMTAYPLARSDSGSWASWNIGPELGAHGDGTIFGNRMPNDNAAVEHFLGSLLPRQVIPNEVAHSSFIAALEKVNKMSGRALFVGWSLSGGLGQRLAVARPDLFKGLVLIEGANGATFPTQDNWFDYCPLNPPGPIVDTLVRHKIPLLSMTALGHSIYRGRSREVCLSLVNMVKAKRGNARAVHLSDIGIKGNSHMLFWEKDSDKTAQVVIDWAKKHLK